MDPPPIWLRKLSLVMDERRGVAPLSMSPAERLRVAEELMVFAWRCLAEQAERRGCSIGPIVVEYERADAHLRARG